MLHVLKICFIGLLAGALAKFLVPGKDPGGWFVTMLLGVAGSFLGTWIGRTVGHYELGQGAGFLMSALGALILLVVYHLVKRLSH